MRTAKALGLVVALSLAAPAAFAQGHKGSGPGGAPPSPEEIIKKKQRDEEEKAAKAAMERIPDSKEKYNPWKIER